MFAQWGLAGFFRVAKRRGKKKGVFQASQRKTGGNLKGCLGTNFPSLEISSLPEYVCMCILWNDAVTQRISRKVNIKNFCISWLPWKKKSFRRIACIFNLKSWLMRRVMAITVANNSPLQKPVFGYTANDNSDRALLVNPHLTAFRWTRGLLAFTAHCLLNYTRPKRLRNRRYISIGNLSLSSPFAWMKRNGKGPTKWPDIGPFFYSLSTIIRWPWNQERSERTKK